MTASIIIFLITYILIASEKLDKTVAAMLGASAAIFFHLIPYEVALRKVDLNVLYLLLGMMVIVNIISTTGFFEWVAVTVAKRAKGNGLYLLGLLLAVTAFLSMWLDNVTTIILIAPVTILITQILELPAVPFLILEAIFSNLGGTATLIGDPPNIIIGSQSHLYFVDFLIHLLPVVIVITTLMLWLCLSFFRKAMVVPEAVRARLEQAEPRRALINPARLRIALPVLGLVILGFFMSHTMRIETGIIALAGAFIMVMVCRVDIHTALAHVEWNTILFFVGLFMLIGCLEYNEVFSKLGGAMVRLTGGNLLLTCIAILWFAAIASAIVDNIPLVIAMIPLIQTIIPVFAAQMGLETGSADIHLKVAEPLYWSLALGACLGGNGSLVGASANVVTAQIARRNKYRMSFMDFTRYGLPIMLLSVLISTFYIWLRYF